MYGIDTLVIIHLKQLEHVAHGLGDADHPLDDRQCVQHLQIIMELKIGTLNNLNLKKNKNNGFR